MADPMIRKQSGRSDDPIWRFLELPIDEVMHHHLSEFPVVVRDSSLDDILSIMRSESYVWVVEDEESMKLVGIIELIELLRYFLPPEDTSYRFGSTRRAMRSFHQKGKPTAGDIVDDAVVCNRRMPVRRVLKRMVGQRVWRIAVTDESGRLTGEVTQKGLIRQFYHYYRYG
jgi:CBS domain-containing protein